MMFYDNDSTFYNDWQRLSYSSLVLVTSPILAPEPVSPFWYMRCLRWFSSIRLF